MIKYDNSVCVRINDTLKSTIVNLCSETNINEADNIKARLTDCVLSDTELHETDKQETSATT